MITSIRQKIIRIILAATVIAVLVGTPLAAPSVAHAGCPTTGEDCSGS